MFFGVKRRDRHCLNRVFNKLYTIDSNPLTAFSLRLETYDIFETARSNLLALGEYLARACLANLSLEAVVGEVQLFISFQKWIFLLYTL